MSDAVTIYIYRQSNGWESDVWRGSDKLGVCTAPSFEGVIDLTCEIISDSDPVWTDFNGNDYLAEVKSKSQIRRIAIEKELG